MKDTDIMYNIESIRRTIDTQMVKYRKFTNYEIWSKLAYFTTDVDLLCLVECLLERCADSIPVDFFPKITSSRLLNVLERSSNPQVQVLTCALISIFCNANSTNKIDLIKRGALYTLLSILKSTYSIKDQEARFRAIQKKLYNSSIFHADELLRRTRLSEQITAMFVYFSLGPKVCQEGLVFEGALEGMFNLLDWRHNQVYAVPPKSKLKVQELTRGLKLVGQKQPMNCKSYQKTLEILFFDKIPECLLVKNGLVLDLYDTNDKDNDVYIIEELHNHKLIWRTSYSNAQDVEVEWVDVEIKTVLSPCQYWCWIGGGKTSDIVADIQKALHTELNEQNLLTEQPLPGDLVIVEKDDKDPYRACVVHLGEKKIQVFALDYGFTRNLPRGYKWLYRLSDPLRSIPAQASYCELKGAILEPETHKIIEYILSSLCNLASVAGISVEQLKQIESISTLLDIAFCEDCWQFRLKAFKILCNMAQSPQLKEKLGEAGLIKMILDMCVKYRTSLWREDTQMVVEIALSLLTNLLHQSLLNKERLIQAGGLEAIFLQQLAFEGTPQRVRGAALQALRVFIGQTNLGDYDKKPGRYTSSDRGSYGKASSSQSSSVSLDGSPHVSSINSPTNSPSERNSGTGLLNNSHPTRNSTESCGSPANISIGEGRSPKRLEPSFSRDKDTTPSHSSAIKNALKTCVLSEGPTSVSVSSVNSDSSPSRPKSRLQKMKELVLEQEQKSSSSSLDLSANSEPSTKSNTSPRFQDERRNVSALVSDVEIRRNLTTVDDSSKMEKEVMDKIVQSTSNVDIQNSINHRIETITLSSNSSAHFSKSDLPESPERPQIPEMDKKESKHPCVKRTVLDSSEGEMLLTQPVSKQEKTPVVLVNVADEYNAKKNKRMYIKDERVGFNCDEAHELCGDRSLHDVRTNIISKVACSFLNTGHEGMIYYGISPGTRKVFGVHVNRDQRDELRIGVDKLMRRIYPPVTCLMYGVEYIPVYSSHYTGSSEPITDLFVIEISLKSMAGSLYTVPKNGGGQACYFRQNKGTYEASLNDVHSKCVAEEEARFRSEVDFLETEIARLKNS